MIYLWFVFSVLFTFYAGEVLLSINVMWNRVNESTLPWKTIRISYPKWIICIFNYPLLKRMGRIIFSSIDSVPLPYFPHYVIKSTTFKKKIYHNYFLFLC